MSNPFRLISDVWEAARPPLARYLPAVDLETTEELLADRSGATKPRVMVFGTYNAGKSTLINAMVGAEVARVADQPETDKVTTYPWRGFLLDDTPGIDAPIAHEHVTREHIDTCDAVRFVLATDGTLEEQRSIDEIVKLVRANKPLRIILNNKSGFKPDDQDFLNLRDRLIANLRRAAPGIEDIETRAPIRLVNAASGLKGRLEGKNNLLERSGLEALEADIVDFCAGTGKADMARTVGQRVLKQIDLALAALPADDGMQPFRETADAVAAERVRLTAVLEHAAQEGAAQFETELTRVVKSDEPQRGPDAAKEAAEAVSAIIDRELRKTQRVLGDIGDGFADKAVAFRPAAGPGIPLPEGIAPQHATKVGGFGLSLSDAAKLMAPALSQRDMDIKIIVGGFQAAKQAFPGAFKGLGVKFFSRVAPLIGPAILAVTGIYNVYSSYREQQREFEREKDRRQALMQQVADAGRKMRWALSQQCQGVIESVFAPVEDALAEQSASLRGQAAMREADRAVLLKCRGRLDIALEK